jgi:hypothetical protein
VDVLCRELPLSRSSLEKKLFFGRVDVFCSFTSKGPLKRSIFSLSDLNDSAVDATLPSVAVLVQLQV